MELINELKRIYTFTEPRWETENEEGFSAQEMAVWKRLPVELKSLLIFTGRENTLPHPDVGMLYGPFEVVEWNCDDGTFGQLRKNENYPFDKVIKFGDDAFWDVAGQIGEPGAVYNAVGHDLYSARLISQSLLDFLKSAGSYN